MHLSLFILLTFPHMLSFSLSLSLSHAGEATAYNNGLHPSEKTFPSCALFAEKVLFSRDASPFSFASNHHQSPFSALEVAALAQNLIDSCQKNGSSTLDDSDLPIKLYVFLLGLDFLSWKYHELSFIRKRIWLKELNQTGLNRFRQVPQRICTVCLLNAFA